LGAIGWLLGALVACGDDPDGPPQIPAPSSTHSAPRWEERLAEPEVTDVLAALAQPHAILREPLGPHHLQVTSDFSLGPPGEADAEEGLLPPAPKVDAPVVTPQAVHDELTLVWASTPEQAMRWSLSQSNDHDRGRDVVVIGETIHVRHVNRGWFHYPRDSDLLELWLDDAQRSVHDAVKLAAPRLTIHVETIPGAGLQQGAALDITLGFADESDAELVARGPTQGWRATAEIEGIEGTLRLDAVSGAWLHAEIDVSYRLPGADGRPLEGHLHLRGDVRPGPTAEVQTPVDSQPLPERVRYEDQERRLLDGLAAP